MRVWKRPRRARPSVSELCTKIVVELHGEAKKKQSSCEGVYLPVEGVVVRGRPVGFDDDNWFVNRTVKMFEQQFDFHESQWAVFHQERKVMMMTQGNSNDNDNITNH